MVNLAPNAMSTAELLKIQHNIAPDDDSYNDLLVLLINYASSWIESQTGRRFGLKEYTESVAGSGTQELVLRQYPIRGVNSVFDRDIKIQLPVGYYSFRERGDIGVLYLDSGWPRRGYHFGLVPDRKLISRYLEISYTAGYILPKDETEDCDPDWLLPADLQGMIAQIAEQELSIIENNSGGLSAFSISDVSWTFDKAPRESWQSILGVYRRVV